MPLTEAPPPQPPGTQGQPPARARRGRAARRGSFDGMGEYDLLHVIDELEDERAHVALREKIWIALILHFLLFSYLIFAPRYLWHVKVRDASEVLRDKEKLTVLDLPPDALKQAAPKAPAAASDKNRQQQSPKPTLDRKTLQALEQMRRASPPRPTPPAQQPTPPAPQVAQAPPAPAQPEPPRPQPNPVPPGQSAQVDAPKPQPTKPNFATPQSPGEAVQQAARQARGGAITDSGDMGANAPSAHAGNKGAVDILSDTLGVDFGPYVQRVIYATKRAWYPIIPEIAQPPISKQGHVLIRFKILPDGSVTEMKLEGPSGTVSLDRAAWAGIVSAAPFPPLPTKFKGPFLELRFYFMYNDNAGIR